MNLERVIVKRKRTWSGLFVHMVLRTWSLLGLVRNLLWGRFWPPRTLLGSLHERLRESSKSRFQFPRGWTSSKFRVDGLAEIYRTLYPGNLVIGKAYNPPPRFFKCDTCTKVLASLLQGEVRCAINFNHNLTEMKGKVRYSPQTREWVLGPIRLSEEGYHLLKNNFRWGRLYIKVEPITEERQTSPGRSA